MGEPVLVYDGSDVAGESLAEPGEPLVYEGDVLVTGLLVYQAGDDGHSRLCQLSPSCLDAVVNGRAKS